MNKRKNEDAENGGTRKKNTTSGAKMAKRKQTAPALKVNVDEWEEIFDYTSLKDLLSMAKTCKRMQTIAGWYFRTYYPNEDVVLHGPNIHIDGMEMNGFREHISHLQLEHEVLYDLRYIAMNKFTVLKKISLWYTRIHWRVVGPIKEFFSQIECIKLWSCQSRGDFYETFLKFCTNLRTLYIENGQTGSFIDGIGNGWLLHEYPTLEHIEFYSNFSFAPIVELKTFLEKNSNLKSLTISCLMYESHQQLFMETNCSLETFSTGYFKNSLGELRTELNALHDRGFYKSLKLNCSGLQDSMDLSFIQGLDELDLTRTPKITTSINAKKITIDGIKNVKDAIAHFINLNTIVIDGYTTSYDLLLTFGHFPALKTLTCWNYCGDYLDLPALNAERAKVPGARKVMIFVEDEVYLATIWKFGHLEFCSVAVKRLSSFNY